MATSWTPIVCLLLLLGVSQQAAGGVMDNVNDGLKMAGQMFGINTAADVANLVAKAFSKATTRKKPDLMSVLQQGFESQRQYDDEEGDQDEEDQSKQESEAENAQESPPVEQGSRRQPLQLNSVQMLTNMMRLIGFDPRKLGALALNAIVMIAQAIGSTIVQATRGAPESDKDSGPEELFEPNDHQPRSIVSGGPIDWFLKRPGANTKRMLRRIMDQQLPEHIVDMIESKETPDGNEAACLKLLMCKSSPIIWGMQNSLKKRLAGEPDDDQDSYMNANAFFKYLPSWDEYKQHGLSCENRFSKYCPRNGTLGKL
ncbi:uncharacterized protein LOC133846113 [Drosophila sulfurigaster albostrigata]|uniref:uncharacterized protein LOC133846113 n=1 Tax=Drosophila sulfurigaster albostrigata TaxID=89887 RepID=UPI002D21AC9A|nr:uncharacterized protein LOC133846113 [Drosophila sulfurigaster albostrigata]